MKRKFISLTEKNYDALKTLGRAGDSFNDVISMLLARMKEANSSTASAINEDGRR